MKYYGFWVPSPRAACASRSAMKGIKAEESRQADAGRAVEARIPLGQPAGRDSFLIR